MVPPINCLCDFWEDDFGESWCYFGRIGVIPSDLPESLSLPRSKSALFGKFTLQVFTGKAIFTR